MNRGWNYCDMIYFIFSYETTNFMNNHIYGGIDQRKFLGLLGIKCKLCKFSPSEIHPFVLISIKDMIKVRITRDCIKSITCINYSTTITYLFYMIVNSNIIPYFILRIEFSIFTPCIKSFYSFLYFTAC